MGSALRSAAIGLMLVTAAPVALAPAALAGPAIADSTPMSRMLDETADFAAQTAGWCLRGATFTIVLSTAFAVPTLVSGVGTPIGLTEIVAAAGAGCGFGVFWGTAFSTANWAMSSFDGTPPAPDNPGPVKSRGPGDPGTPIRLGG